LPTNQEQYSKSKRECKVKKSHANIKDISFILRHCHDLKSVYSVDEMCLRLSHAESKVVCDTRTCTRGPKGYLNTFIILLFTYIVVLTINLKKFFYVAIFPSDFVQHASQLSHCQAVLISSLAFLRNLCQPVSRLALSPYLSTDRLHL